MTIRNLNWELETTFTRKQVIAMAKLAEYVHNIETDLSREFPSGFKNMDWTGVREVMLLFARLGAEDTLSYRALVKTVQDVHEGKFAIISGKVVEVEQSSK